jgi:hypothetical protein
VDIGPASLQPLRQASWHIGRDAAPSEHGAARAPGQPTALPPAAPPSCGEGDLWGDLQAVGRETGSLLRLLKRTPPIPHPFP